MIFLEIAMIVIGLVFIFYSVRISDTSEKIPIESADDAAAADQENEKRRLQEMLDSFTQKAESVYSDMDNRMSQVSNEKIMGISEYSDQVIEKIEKNHDEVVFLYEMMNKKQEEIKDLVQEIDSLRADIHDESAKEYQKMHEQEKRLDEIKKSVELDILELQSQQNKFHQKHQKSDGSTGDSAGGMLPQDTAFSDDTTPEDDFETVSVENSPNDGIDSTNEKEDTPSVYDVEIAKIEEEEIKSKMFDDGSGQSDDEQSEFVNHNDEIIALYKKGRSILEISRMLSLGQGEVKFVIDLYNAR